MKLRMNIRGIRFLAVSWAIAASLPAGPARAQMGPADLAIIPFANNTGQSAVHSLLMPVLEQLLAERGLNVVGSDSLRPLLRQHRVRSRGWISRRGVELVRGQTGARYLLLGSWDVLRTEGTVEAGVSMRLLDVTDGRLLRAVSLGATGEDNVTWLGLGKVSDVSQLIPPLLSQALDELKPGEPRAPSTEPQGGCQRLAVIPLNNYAALPHAGDIMTNILLSRLLAAGYFVVEPGYIRELGLAREVVNRGGIDRASAQAIFDSLGACQVITGDVQEFAPARGRPTVSVPRLAAGFRSSSTRQGNLLVIREIEGAGSDDDGFFQLGRIHAITPLAVELVDKFVADLRRFNRKDISHDHENQ